jgi:hypothetical protein
MAQEVDKDVEEFLDQYVGKKFRDEGRAIMMEWIRQCNKLGNDSHIIYYAEKPHGVSCSELFEFLKKKFGFKYIGRSDDYGRFWVRTVAWYDTP